jgi:hypothetical protein
VGYTTYLFIFIGPKADSPSTLSARSFSEVWLKDVGDSYILAIPVELMHATSWVEHSGEKKSKNSYDGH